MTQRSSDPSGTHVLIRLDVRRLDPCFEAIALASSLVEIERAAVAFTIDTGFDHFTALHLYDDFCGADSVAQLDILADTAADYLVIQRDENKSRVDPVLRMLKSSSLPVTYDQRTYAQSGCGPLWEEQAAYGYAEGIAIALHLPRNRHFLFGVDRRLPLPADPGVATNLIARVQLFTSLVHVAMQDCFGYCPDKTRHIATLSPRERECLRWAADGKTAWETGRILSIAEASVAKILAAAIRKLDCANKPQAVVKALRLGVIH